MKKASLCLFALLWLAWIVWKASPPHMPQSEDTDSQTFHLRRDTMTLEKFRPDGHPTAIILFASGDGGWTDFEDDLAETLQEQGYEVIGIDSASYAETDYDLDTLQSDFSRIADEVRAPFGAHPPPLIVGGYSMGAAQAIAVAGGPHPPRGLAGLILVDPCSRGRYGLRTSDKVNILPTGPGTFAVADFATAMDHLRIVQWHADDDDIDSRAWLETLKAPHREFDFPGTGHDYQNDRGRFLTQFGESVGWLINPNSPSRTNYDGGF